jgi:hypothetical protein
MCFSREPDSNTNEENDLQSRKQSSPIISSAAGMEIDCKDEQPQNADSPIRVSFESDSNVNEESAVQSRKESSPMISTEAGTQIDRNEEQAWKALVSILVTRDTDSNESDESERHQEKHPVASTSMLLFTTTEGPEAKYRTITSSVRRIRTGHENRNSEFSQATTEMDVAARADPSRNFRKAGREIDFNDEHP